MNGPPGESVSDGGGREAIISLKLRFLVLLLCKRRYITCTLITLTRPITSSHVGIRQAGKPEELTPLETIRQQCFCLVNL